MIPSLPSQGPWSVLLVEDNDRHADLVRQTLVRTGDLKELCRVSRLTEAIACLCTESFDVILADLTLPDSDSMAAVTTLCSHAPHTPVVVLTAPVNGPTAMSALHSGAQDYWRRTASIPRFYVVRSAVRSSATIPRVRIFA